MMVTTDHEDLDRILRELEPDHIPAEFVSGARVTDTSGDVYVISRDELDDIMDCDESLDEQGIAEIRLILDFEEVKVTIRKYSAIILSSSTL